LCPAWKAATPRDQDVALARAGRDRGATAAVAGHLVAENSMFAFLAAHQAKMFGGDRRGAG